MADQPDDAIPAEAVVVAPAAPAALCMGTFQASTPADVLDFGAELANALKVRLKNADMISNISGKEYVKVEGWCTLATIMGVIPREVSSVKRDDGAYEATVELVRQTDGFIVTCASSLCSPAEKMWSKRDEYAVKSMATTRATGKACRIAFAAFMGLTGYATTPAEEMPTPAERRAIQPDLHPLDKSPNFGKPWAELSDMDLDKALDFCKQGVCAQHPEFTAAHVGRIIIEIQRRRATVAEKREQVTGTDVLDPEQVTKAFQQEAEKRLRAQTPDPQTMKEEE